MQIPKGIRPRGNKFFVDITVNGGRKTATCNTLEDAIAVRQQLKLGMEAGKDLVTSRSNAKTWTIREALDKTLSLPAPEGWKGIAYEKQATLNVEDAITFWGPSAKLDQLSRVQIDAWTHSLEEKGNSNSTINRKLSALSKIMKLAVEYGGLASMPKLPKQRKEPVGRIRQISPEEELKLLATLRLWGVGDHARAIEVLIDTGMRCSELWNVQWQDINFKTGTLMIYGVTGRGTKNGTFRSVPMTDRVRKVFERTKGWGSPTECPFPHSNSWLRREWDKVRAHMGLTDDKNFSPHVCRHTCASRLAQNGIPMPVVQKYLGHKTIQTTMIYTHLYPADLQQAANSLNGGTRQPETTQVGSPSSLQDALEMIIAKSDCIVAIAIAENALRS